MMELQIRPRQGDVAREAVSPSSFAQQGTVDWLSLANASISASVSLLTRLSGCGVELWTAAVAQVIMGNIHLSHDGQTRMNEALSKLRSFGSYGDAIYFGFGIKHIVRTLADSREGLSTIALCASVAEVHEPSASAYIIYEYAKLCSGNSPPDLMPSVRQWGALTKCCSGVLSTSPFGVIVEFFMSFHPRRSHLSNGDPKEIAHAIEGIAKISNRHMKSMMLEGGSECGFIAAVAQYFLGLRVVIRNAAGDFVYPSTGVETENFQLMVTYVAETDNHKSQAISRKSDTYYITSVFDLHSDNNSYGILSGRVEWATAMQQTFGSSAIRLLETPNILGEILGSAARMYTILDTAPQKLGSLIGKAIRFGSEASGRPLSV